MISVQSHAAAAAASTTTTIYYRFAVDRDAHCVAHDATRRTRDSQSTFDERLSDNLGGACSAECGVRT